MKSDSLNISSANIQIIGSGLAGSEAAHYLARRGFSVTLYEMRPKKLTAAHHTGQSAELVCSNSLKSESEHSAPFILKREMNTIGSLVLDAAYRHRVPAGEALAVDREKFAEEITNKLRSFTNITWKNEEVLEPSTSQDQLTLIATGPLTSESLARWILKQTDSERDLYFYDAIAPIVDASTIDLDRSFFADRYDKSGQSSEVAYLNCPLTKEEYEDFIDSLLKAEKVLPKSFEKEIYFQGCQPIEAIAEKGRESLRFGPMKPIGLTDPRTGRHPYAVVQLRPENISRTAYNLVGFQTRLKWGEQKKILQKIPALSQAEFLRFGSIHRNTYVCAPRVLRTDLSLKSRPNIYLAGQITGVEGYLESAACGLLAAVFLEQRLLGKPHSPPPPNTALGALLRTIIASPEKNYQPNNIHFGLFEHCFFDLPEKAQKDEIRKTISEQSFTNLERWWVNFSGDIEQKLPLSHV